MDYKEKDKIKFPDGSICTIHSMLEDTPLEKAFFQMTDDKTGELFTEPLEILDKVEKITA